MDYEPTKYPQAREGLKEHHPEFEIIRQAQGPMSGDPENGTVVGPTDPHCRDAK